MSLLLYFKYYQPLFFILQNLRYIKKKFVINKIRYIEAHLIYAVSHTLLRTTL